MKDRGLDISDLRKLVDMMEAVDERCRCYSMRNHNGGVF
jgi:hypothetical protein